MVHHVHAAPEPGRIKFRTYRGPEDLSMLRSIFSASTEADQIAESRSASEFAKLFVKSERFDPMRDTIIATAYPSANKDPIDIGFAFTPWYTGPESVRHYYQESYLLPTWRGQGIWARLVRASDARLSQKASDDQISADQGKLFAFARNTQRELMEALESEGYAVVRRFYNMIHSLHDISTYPLPAGIETRAVDEGHLRRIWDAQHEVNRELYEYNANRWTEKRYKSWLRDSAKDHSLWQIAWDGDQVAGLVLGKIDEDENRQRDRQRGYTHSVLIRSPWRRIGLGKALITRCLQALKERGMNEAELGVDSINESGAFSLYQSLGYKTESTDIWYSKPLI